MGRRSRERRRLKQEQLEKADLKEYSVQATPFMIRDLGWEVLKHLAEATYPGFNDKDFRPLVFRPDGSCGVDGRRDPASEQGDAVKVFFASLSEIPELKTDRVVMIIPYRDGEGIKVLYFKWAEETLYDSFAAPDGQNRVWDNKEKK
jgi:hypothetical protein